MLLAIIQVYSYLGATDFALLSVSEISFESQKIIWLNTLLQQQGADQQIF
jgi:NADH-ubiquinone oxidoreductase chain 4